MKSITRKLLLTTAFFFLLVFITSSPITTVNAEQDRLMTSKLRIGGGDLLMVDSSEDADDYQITAVSGGGTRLNPCVDSLIFPKDVDFDIEEGQMKQYGMDTSQYSDDCFINASVDAGVKIEETGGSGDPVETTAFSIGSDYGYGKVTLNAASADTYAGYSWQTDVFDDVDGDGVQDDAENAFLSDFDENTYIYITAKLDYTTNGTASACTHGEVFFEISLVFATSGTSFELEAIIDINGTSDAGNTGWTNFDDASADNKATFTYGFPPTADGAGIDGQILSFLFMMDMMDYYDEDDYSSIKGLDYIDYRLVGWGNSGVVEGWVYNVAFIKNPAEWNVGTYTHPSITESGALDVPQTVVPSYTAAAETDGGMYLFTTGEDYPVTTVTEASSVTSVFTNLINIDQQLVDGDILPLNWRKVKFESDQSGTNLEDDYNLELLPTSYSYSNLGSHADGGTSVREKFTFDFTGMDDISTGAYLLTWDTATDEIFIEDRLLWDNMADDIFDHSDPAELVVSAYEGFAQTYDATNGLKTAWANEVDRAYVQYEIVKDVDTTTGDIIIFERTLRYNSDFIPADAPVEGPALSRRTTNIILIGGACAFGAAILLIVAKIQSGRSQRRR